MGYCCTRLSINCGQREIYLREKYKTERSEVGMRKIENNFSTDINYIFIKWISFNLRDFQYAKWK